MYARIKLQNRHVFIPVFPGTNCEYDSAKAFERAGADVVDQSIQEPECREISVILSMYLQKQSIRHRSSCSRVDSPQVMSRMDLQNSLQLHSVMQRSKKQLRSCLNERDGLALGICNGFQALIKLGLVPYGEICGQKADSPTLTYNTIGPSYFQDGLYKGMSAINPHGWQRQNLAGCILQPGFPW